MPSYEPLTVVASDDYQDGYRTYGVLDGGAFVPLGGQKIGHVTALAAAVDENDPHVADTPETQASNDHEQRIAALEDQVAAIPPPPDPAPPATE